MVFHQVKNVGFPAGFWGCTLQIYTNTCTSRKMVCILTSYVQVNIIYRDAKIQVSKHTTMQRSTYIHFTKIHIRIHTISNYWTIWILIPIPWNLPKKPTKPEVRFSLIDSKLPTSLRSVLRVPCEFREPRLTGGYIYTKTPREPSPPRSGPLPARQVRHLLLRPSLARSMARRAGRLAITSLSHEEPEKKKRPQKNVAWIGTETAAAASKGVFFLAEKSIKMWFSFFFWDVFLQYKYRSFKQ